MAGASGEAVCTSTRPPRGPRPARPASCATSANVRSSARKSGKRRVASASSTTPSVTSGKSWPLATICVPSSSPAGAASKRASSCGTASLAPAVSASSRKTGTSSASASSCSRRSVPAPWRATASEPQASQRCGTRLAVAAVVAGDRALRAVQHERDVALRALPDLAAGAAGEEVRPAAAVEQHDRLARLAERPPRLGVQRVPRCRACRAPAPAAAGGRRRARAASAAASPATSPAAASPSRRAARAPARRARSAATRRAS